MRSTMMTKVSSWGRLKSFCTLTVRIWTSFAIIKFIYCPSLFSPSCTPCTIFYMSTLGMDVLPSAKCTREIPCILRVVEDKPLAAVLSLPPNVTMHPKVFLHPQVVLQPQVHQLRSDKRPQYNYSAIIKFMFMISRMRKAS